MVLDESGTDDMNEVPVQCGINNKNNHFGRAVPVLVDVYKAV